MPVKGRFRSARCVSVRLCHDKVDDLQNSHLHEAFSASEPPYAFGELLFWGRRCALTIGGPMPDAKDHVRPSIPWYIPRSASGTRSEVMISVKLMMPPPPTPWMAGMTKL